MSQATHGGAAYAWETVLENLEGEPTAENLKEHLEERGVGEPSQLLGAGVERDELVLEGDIVRTPSRQSNSTKCVNDVSGANTDKQSERVREKVEEFVEEYPDRAELELAESHGVSIRREYANIEYEEWQARKAEPENPFERPPSGESVSDVSAVTWAEAVETLVESYETTQRTTLNLQFGVPGENAEESWRVPARSRWAESYQRKYFGQIDAWLRELTSGERPSGGEAEGEFDDPYIALITRSASSIPNGERIGPVEHANRLKASWREVYHQTRNTLRSLGFESDEWQYVRVVEPHTGKRGSHGTNEAYPHEHVVLVVDGEVSASGLRPIIDKHVDVTEGATEEAHGAEAIEVKHHTEMDDVASYVASYASIEPTDLFDRSPAYVGFAAVMSALNMRTISRSDPARWAAQADACKQRFESEESEQSVAHGEEVRRSEKGANTVECAVCGSPHGINQEQTLTEHRLSETNWRPDESIAPDGGYEPPDRVGEMREECEEHTWTDALGEEKTSSGAVAAAQVGESIERAGKREQVREFLESERDDFVQWITRSGERPTVSEFEELKAEIEHPEFDPNEPVGFERDVHPRWYLYSITVDGEEHMASSGGGVDMVEITNYREVVREAIGVEESMRYRCKCGAAFYGSTVVTHILDVHGIDDPEIAEASVVEE